MKGWPVVKLGELFAETQYGTAQKANTERRGLPVLRMNNITYGGAIDLSDLKWCEVREGDRVKYTVRRGDLLFNRTNSPELVGKTAVWDRDENYAYAGYLVRIRFGEQVDSRWVSAVLNSPYGKKMLYGRARPSNNMSNLSPTVLARISIPVPPLSEQRRFIDILDKADAIRRKRQEAIALTESLLRSAFLKMFGDPVTNPKGWPVVAIGDVVTRTQYGTADKANEEGRGLPVLRMNNITYGGEINANAIKWCELDDKDLEKFTVHKGDLLFNRTNSPELVGKTAVWDRDDRYVFAGYLVRVRFDESRMLPHFASGFLNSAYGKRYLFAKAKPSNNMSNFSAGEFVKIPIPLPPIGRQRDYEAVLGATRRTQRRLREAGHQDEKLFNALVQRAFRCELG